MACRLSGLQKTAIADVDDENRDVAPAPFGDYYYQDKVSTQITRDPQHLLALGHGAAEHVGLDAAISQGQRQAYLLEDGSGRLSVVEHESRSLPDGGRMTWQRTTGPGGGGFCRVVCYCMLYCLHARSGWECRKHVLR